MNTEKDSQKRSSRKGYLKTMKLIRRVHMYLGLLLVPWVLLFGIGGFLFNHNTTFWGGSVETLSTFDAGIAPVDAEAIANTLIEQINESTGETYTLNGSPWFAGHLHLSGKTEDKNIDLAVSLADGATKVSTKHRPSIDQDKPSFHNQSIDPPIIDVKEISKSLETHLAEEGLKPKGELSIPGRGPNVDIRFTLTDSAGRDWRVGYNVAKAKLSAVADDSESRFNFYSAATRLHKTHVYPDTMGAKWIWTMIADITAISMILWALTGLVMWWQIQPTRAIGTLALFVAIIIAFAIFSGTLADYGYNPQ